MAWRAQILHNATCILCSDRIPFGELYWVNGAGNSICGLCHNQSEEPLMRRSDPSDYLNPIGVSQVRANLEPSETVESTKRIDLGDRSTIDYIRAEFSQELADNGYKFGFNQGGGHAEFYKFVELIAMPIYSETTGKRCGLLVIDPMESDERIGFRVREEIRMLEKLAIGPVIRRIKV